MVIYDNDSSPREREMYVIRELKDQLSSTRELTEDCLAELRVSKEMLSFLRERICSLKKLLKQKSDELATLQADHQMMKVRHQSMNFFLFLHVDRLKHLHFFLQNDYSILKTGNGIFAEKARAEIREFREKVRKREKKLK